jgi:hypothetical protein
MLKIIPMTDRSMRWLRDRRIRSNDDPHDCAEEPARMPETATVFADGAGVIGSIMAILVWVSSYEAYL